PGKRDSVQARSTPKGLHRRNPRRLCNPFGAAIRSGAVDSPGCAARPWAVVSNPFGVEKRLSASVGGQRTFRRLHPPAPLTRLLACRLRSPGSCQGGGCAGPGCHHPLSSRCSGGRLTKARARGMISPSSTSYNEGFAMRKHDDSRRLLGWLGVTLLALLGAGGTATAGDKKAPKPLPPEIVQAWEQAGAKAGWMGRNENGILVLRSGGEGKAGEVPGFYF